MASPLRVVVLLSGSGTTLQNLIDHAALPGCCGSSGCTPLPAEIVAVISSNSQAYGLERARRAGIPTWVVERKGQPSRAVFSQKILDICREVKADLVCMAGFLHLLDIAPDFEHRIMNIHPSLIPAFCGKGFHGLHVHQAVLEAGVKVSGCTVHFADNQYDHGPIILQRVVPVEDDDTPERLAARVFAAECAAYPEAIRLFAQGRIQVEGRRVRIR